MMMKSLEEQLREFGVGAMELGSAPASLENNEGVDHWIVFEAIEQTAIHTNVLDGFGEEYSTLHALNDRTENINVFLEEIETRLGEDSELFEELFNYIDSFVTNMLWEAEDIARERELELEN